MSILMSVVGAQQGKIYGAGPNREWSVLSFSSGITSPVDASTGQLTGRRQHEPCLCVVDYGENIAHLMSCATTGESLTVTMSFLDDTTGEVYISTTLTNALLFDYSMSSGGDRPTESLSFTFQKIEFKSGNSNYTDTWSGSTTGA